MRRPAPLVGLALAVLIGPPAIAAGAATGAAPLPLGRHPRIALTPATLAALRGRVSVAGSAVAAAVAACRNVTPAPGLSSGYQGDGWAFPASACALAWQVTRERAFATKGVRLWRALLEDVDRLGDGKACVGGASPGQAITAIQRDTGYAIRFIGPHAALAYDWLHDAPGATEPLRRQSRACFGAWVDWYTTAGYLRAQPGANYHAGFVLAKTLIAIAEGGEDGARGDRYWTELVDDVFGAQLVANGLAADNAGVPRGRRHGALVGGDWPEGWQYGPLSVLEYAFAARAMNEQRVTQPALAAWADALTVRFLHGLLPGRRGQYVGGDVEGAAPYLPVSGGVLLATLVGPSSDRAAAWAAFLRAQLDVRRYGPPVFDALAEARAVAPADPQAAARRPWFLAGGTRNLYARSGWDARAFWAVFTSAPRQVDDHQHPDASNFVFSRGADPLVVDPSPYATRSTLTSNAVAVDSARVGVDYQPSQTFWSAADLPWARATASGVIAARAELERAFDFNGAPSDVPLARRDWVFLPEGEVVVIDRVLTGGPRRKAYLRFRTPAALRLAPGPSPSAAAAGAGGFVARGAAGASSALAIHAVTLRPAAAPSVVSVPRATECPGRAFGACAVARFPVTEYRVTLTGPEVLAVHVLDGLDRNEAPAQVSSLGAPASEGSANGSAGGGATGARIARGGQVTFVVGASRAGDAVAPPATLGYATPGAQAARHVVFDAPEDGRGRAAVTAAATVDGRCQVTLGTAGPTRFAGRPVVFTVGPAAAGCAVAEDPDLPPDAGP